MPLAGVLESQTVWLVVLVLYGLAFGSFANVVVWRLPRGESLSSPPSRCPSCGAGIRWYDNLPVVSWIALRARCRDCGVRISARYPLVEALSGALFGLAWLAFEEPGRVIAAAGMFWFLLVLAFIDLDTMRLLNPLVAALAGSGLVLSLVAQVTGLALVPLTPLGEGLMAEPLVSSAAGAALGAGTSLAIALVYSMIRKQEGFGMGDVKLLGAMGFFLGPYVLVAFVTGTLLGAAWGLVAMGWRGLGLRDRMPFGPFLAIGGLVAATVGSDVVAWYLGVVGLG